MSAYQKRFLMMHNNPAQKKIGCTNSWSWYRQSAALTITPPQRDNEVGRIKLYNNQLYFITIIGIHLTNEPNKNIFVNIKSKMERDY